MNGAVPTGARVLIVDDEAPHVNALCRILRDHGYDPHGYTSGEAALEALRDTPCELLLADLMMPGLDGIALLRAARELDPDLVGIIMTGEGTIASAVEAMKSGALDYVLKPLRLNVVLPVIARAIGIRRLRLENRELSRSILERTAELESANRELEAFAYSVSHDLRAPLRAIDGFSRLLAEQFGAELPREARELLDRVVAGAERMDALIADMLRLAQVGQKLLDRAPVDVEALVHEVAAEACAAAQRSSGVEVGALPGAHADAGLLRQVFSNLLSNALKFTRHVPAPAIHVGSRREGAEIVYFVRDNGAGFDMREVSRLFGAFQRLHGASQYEGSGIGLSIVQRIVQRHGGRIWAEGELGRGATFSFTLGTPPPARSAET